jgi:putative N6-adenine-specific DNA methylase
MKNNNFEMIAKTLYGLEDVLAAELNETGASNVETGRRMVSFYGDKEMLYKANFYCRTALRILKPIAKFKAHHADDVYENVKSIEWEKYLSTDKTFTVDAVVYSDTFNHSKFVAYKTKDAVADYFSEKTGDRPSVRLNNPDLYINIHISHTDCTVSIDSSGESLHKRGYRVTQVDAPLNEVLAAGMILKSGWRGESNFIDPMCGSGTLLVEAAMIALNLPPGLFRKEFAFEHWPDFDKELFDEISNDESHERPFKYKCYGSDISAIAIGKAKQNVERAGLSGYTELSVLPFQQFSDVPRPGILVMNPPYGERLSSNDIMDLYNMIGERLKHAFPGFEAWILSYKDECFDKIGLRPKHKIKLRNGDLECEYRCYELFEGANKDFKRNRNENPERRYSERKESSSDNTIEKEWRAERSDRHNRLRDRRKGIEEGRLERREKRREDRRFPGSDEGNKNPERRPFKSRDKSQKDSGRRPFDKDKKFGGDKLKKTFNKDSKERTSGFNRDKRKSYTSDRNSNSKGRSSDTRSRNSDSRGKSFGTRGRNSGTRGRKSLGDKTKTGYE